MPRPAPDHRLPPGADALLSQTRWMRALAMGLVADPNEADDVAQEAALAALQHGPKDRPPSRAWLATVVRNFAWRRRRTETRRADREALVAGSSADPVGGLDAVERIDTHRMLLEAVRALDEPLRSTVVQRYLEGRTSADIARATGVPQGTVRARLKRGLERLRERLDDEHSSRGAWMALVAPIALPAPPPPSPPSAPGIDAASTTAALAQGTFVMSLVKFGLSGTLVLLAALGGWRITQTTSPAEPSEVEPIAAAEPVLPAVERPEVVAAVPEAGGREALASHEPSELEPEPALEAPVSKKAEASLEGRFVDEYGVPLPEVELVLWSSDGRRRTPSRIAEGRSDRSGLARVVAGLPSWASANDTGVASATLELVARRRGRTSHRQRVLLREARTTQLGDIALVPAARLQGRVVDERGVAVEGALVGAVDASQLEGLSTAERDRIGRRGSDAFDRLTATRSHADGGFELGGLPAGSVRVWAHAPERRYGLTEPLLLEPLIEGIEVEVVVPDFGPRDRIAGQVVGPDGEGRRAWITRDMRTGSEGRTDSIDTDANGRFSFPVAFHDATYQLTAADPFKEYSRVQVTDVRPGDMDLEIAFRAPIPLLVRLRDAEGHPVEGAEISIGIDGYYSAVPVEVSAPGDYVVDRPSGTFHLEANAPGFRESDGRTLDDTTAPDTVDIVMERALVVEGQVVVAGQPVEGAIVEAFRYDPSAATTVNGLRCPISRFERGTARTDADGRFRLEADVDGAFVVRARHADHVDAETAPMTPEEAGEPVALELTDGGAIEGTVRVPPGETAGGLIVAAHRGDGRPRSVRTAPDGTYRFEGLMPGAWNVFLTEDDIDPRAGSYSSVVTDEPLTWDCRVELGRTTRFDLDRDS
ncbi:MAG: sigma-70 family RNA polymerase sigma factor [Planctomycetota bacterium]